MSDYSYLTGEGTPSLPELGTEVAASFVPGLNIAQALRDYKKAAKENKYVDMGLSALGLVPGAAGVTKAMLFAGALRKDLQLARGTAPASLIKDNKLVSELMSPSMAIMKGRLPAMYGDTVLIPQLGKFDPKTHNSTLYGEDAYTGAFKHLTEQTPSARLDLRFKPEPTNPNTPSYNPLEFSSFASFEKHPGGAARLRTAPDRLSELPTDMYRYAQEYMQKHGIDDLDSALYDIYSGGIELSKNDIKLKSWLRNKAPTDYAELKVHGPVPLNSDNFAGAISKAGHPLNEQLRELFNSKGMSFAESSRPEYATDLANLLRSVK